MLEDICGVGVTGKANALGSEELKVKPLSPVSGDKGKEGGSGTYLGLNSALVTIAQETSGSPVPE